MRILLDTHMIIWALLDDPKLPGSARRVIEDECNEIFVSTASLWEIQIKHILHPTMYPNAQIVERYCSLSGFNNVKIGTDEIFGLTSLRYSGDSEHKDPFDRILISQAKTYDMVFLTSDSKLEGYGEPCVLKC